MEDNARKFIVKKIGQDFLKDNKAISFTLTVDWIETNEDSEKKIVYKEFGTGELQILLVSKIVKDGNRISDKKKISEEEYKNLLTFSTTHLEKKRYEFNFIQNNINYVVKYDEFAPSNLCILEVDAPSEEDRKLFDPNLFQFKLAEVTGDTRYYGYRIVKIVK